MTGTELLDMYILSRDWRHGYLDYALNEGQSRIQVRLWQNLAAVDDAFFVRHSDWRMLATYLREIGPTQVYRKVLSRHSEQLRNDKFISLGVGTILETKGDTYVGDDQVVFLAPMHPRCVDRVSLPDDLIRRADSNLILPTKLEDGVVLYAGCDRVHLAAAEWDFLTGWSEHSGEPLNPAALDALFESVLKLLEEDFSYKRLQVQPRHTCEKTGPIKRSPHTNDEMSASLFGLGNYAKTVILPNIDSRLKVGTVHEIDPTQLGPVATLPWTGDSSGELRSEERPEVVFIAGFHHTHADLAVAALEGGSCAVVEKPLATTPAQLKRILTALRRTDGRLFVCYHKRYLKFNRYIYDDLGALAGEPISCHCLVYETPLPRLHWYNWPNSGSRIISNGCHWIDHFLFLNRFAAPVAQRVWQLSSGAIVIAIDLDNHASFSMTLTDEGSKRIGVQEHVEFRANGATATIENGSYYSSESASKVIRRKRINKMQVYKEMYEQISHRIISGSSGDSVNSIRVSTSTILEIEEEYHRCVAPLISLEGTASSKMFGRR